MRMIRSPSLVGCHHERKDARTSYAVTMMMTNRPHMKYGMNGELEFRKRTRRKMCMYPLRCAGEMRMRQRSLLVVRSTSGKEQENGKFLDRGSSLSQSQGEALQRLMQSNMLPDAHIAKSLGLSEEALQSIMELPGTKSLSDVKMRLASLSQWNAALRKGILPTAGEVTWPQEPFRSKFIEVLKKLEMPRFTRRHPKLLASLLRQFLQLAGEFEGGMLDEQSKNSKKEQNKQKQQQKESQSDMSNFSPEGDNSDTSEQPPPEGGNEMDDMESQSSSQESQNVSEGTTESEATSETDVQLELEGVQMSGENSSPTNEEDESGDANDAESYAETLAKKMLDKFEEDWGPAMEAMDAANMAFDDIDGLMDGPEGFDASSAVWHDSGWREVATLSKRLESLRELRDLVRSLGRGGGKGPLKRAPQQIFNTGSPLGVVLSEQSPEETRGLTRSGDISRMLPLEAGLLAAGWTRQQLKSSTADENINYHSAVQDSKSSAEIENDKEISPKKIDISAAARRLFMARRAERQLMSYMRSGWVDDEPSKLTGRMEMRPAAELGPIIVCLDTSGSMHGSRELVAKALTLEAMRGAHRQSRKCYVYAFSGPGDVMELELGTDQGSFLRLLKFLKMSFSGGTDVDAPLALSLDKLGQEGWELADILMVTDGEINHPHQDILDRLQLAHDDLGLDVHGLLVGSRITDPMKVLCNELHVFKSWSAVGGRPFDMPA